MQPQPAASISAPPPPPPPLSLAAFTHAASTTSRYAPPLRKPTLQLAVVLGSATPALLRHAHHTLCALAAKGIHGFLQTEIERSATAVCTPITPELLPDIVAASRADFLVLLSDRNLRTRTVQLRLVPNSDFIDVPLARLCDIVLDAWTQRLRTVTDVVHLQSLAANPNVVTTAHLDSLLHSISNLSALRRSYAKLARLANITQHWHSLPLSPSHPHRSHHVQHQKQPQTQPQPQHQQQHHNSNLPNASISSLSNTSSVPSSVASPWQLSEHPSTTPSSALSVTSKTSLANLDHLSSKDHDPPVPPCQPCGKPDTPANRSPYSPQLRLAQQGFATSTEPQLVQQQPTTNPSTNTTQSTPTASNSESAVILDSDQHQHPEQPSVQQSTENPSTQSVTPTVPCVTDRADLSSEGDEHAASSVHPLAARALRRGLKSITRTQERKQRSSQASDLHSEFTFSWLKRSEHLSAKLMRHQFLACHLHRNLMEARDFISQMQVSSRPTRYYDSKRLPTEAHRQRLLREIHDLVPRIEELGNRLCKRPTARRQRHRYHETNPWDAYIARAQYATIARGIHGLSERQREFESSAWWRCWACRALNSSDTSKCTACRTAACGTTSSSSSYADRLTERMREAIQNAQVAPPPWVFAPEVLPLPPPVAHPLANRWLRNERGGPESLPLPFFGDDGLNDPSWRYNAFSQGVSGPSERHTQARDGFNLTAALNKLSCDDEYQKRENEISRRENSAVDRASEFRMSSSTRRNPQVPFPNRNATPRLATSAPSGPSHISLVSRVPKNGMHSNTARKGMGFEESSTGPSILQNLGLDTQTYKLHKQAPVLTGSFPSIDPRGSRGLYGSRPSGSSSTQEAHQTGDAVGTKAGFRERNYPSRFKSSLAQPMEELALRSYEAKKSEQRFPSEIHPLNSPRVSGANGEYQSGDIASLKALAAASDAANGGTGSATKESLRTVSAAITAAEDESQKPVAASSAPNGMYNMF